MTGEVDHHFVQASRAFGSLHSAVFMAHDLSVETKRLVYRSVVLRVYSAETWVPTQVLVRKLEWFITIVFIVLWVFGELYNGQSVFRCPVD